MGRVPLVRLLLAHVAGPDLRCVSDPDLVSQILDQFDEPLAVPRRLHADQHRPRQVLIELFRIACGMHQFLLPRFPRLRIQPTHLLPAGMEITPYNHHCEDSFLPRSLSPQTKTTGSIESSLLSNQSFSRTLRKGWVMGIGRRPWKSHLSKNEGAPG